MTTTVHTTRLMYKLRNRFKQEFKINTVMFHPDEKSIGFGDVIKRESRHQFTDIKKDVWLAISDKTLDEKFSNEVKDCEWVVLLTNEFTKDTIHHYKATLPIADEFIYWSEELNLGKYKSDSIFNDHEISQLYRTIYDHVRKGTNERLLGFIP